LEHRYFQVISRSRLSSILLDSNGFNKFQEHMPAEKKVMEQKKTDTKIVNGTMSSFQIPELDLTMETGSVLR